MNFRAIVLLVTVAAATRVPTHPAQHKAALAATKHAIVKAEVKHTQPQPKGQPQLPQKCVDAMERMKKPEFAKKAAKCEQDGQYPQKAIASLQNGDDKGATGHIEDLFVNCAQLPKECAAKVAPELVIQLRFSGAAVSDECAQKMEEVQKDESKAKEMEQCDKKNKLTENVLVALNKGDLKGAIGEAETGLEKCLGMSEKCSYQIAPVLVNSVVMRAMMQQGAQEEVPMTTVMVAQPVIVVEEPVMVVEEVPAKAVAPATTSAAKAVAKSAAAKKKHGHVSLLAIAAGKAPRAGFPRRLRKAKAPALLQETEGTKHYAWVSKLIIQLAKDQHI